MQIIIVDVVFSRPLGIPMTVLALDHCFGDCLAEQLKIQHNIGLWRCGRGVVV